MKGEIKNLATETVSVIDTNMSLIQDFLHGVFDFQSLYHLDFLFRYCYKKSYFFLSLLDLQGYNSLRLLQNLFFKVSLS